MAASTPRTVAAADSLKGCEGFQTENNRVLVGTRATGRDDILDVRPQDRAQCRDQRVVRLHNVFRMLHADRPHSEVVDEIFNVGHPAIHMGCASRKSDVVIGTPTERSCVGPSHGDLAIGERGSTISHDRIQEQIQTAGRIVRIGVRDLLLKVDVAAVQPAILHRLQAGQLRKVAIDVENYVVCRSG